MKPEQGIYPGLSQEEYGQIEALRFSDLKHLDRSPLLYHYRKQYPIVQTEPMKIGNACHLAILEPSLADFAIWPGPGIRAGHAFKAWAEANSRKMQLNEKEAAHVTGVSSAVHANPVAHKYLEFGLRELSIVWFDKTWNRWMKARIDNAVRRPNGEDGPDILVSLKTTADCHDRLFAMQYVKMNYHAQDAIYQSGWYTITGNLPRMVTIAVDSKPPYESAVYEMDNEWLNEGQAAVKRWIQQLNVCEKTNTWPVAYPAERELEFPGWAATLDEFSMDDLDPVEAE